MGSGFGFIYILATLKWGDWRNWQLYYPTILFLIIGDFIYQFFLYDNYPMWIFHPVWIDKNIGLTHTHITILVMLIKYPCTVLMYLGNYPYHSKLKQIRYILLWVFIYTFTEIFDLAVKGVTHHNGWNLGWSMIFDVVMFLLLALHYKRPLLAWFFSFIFIVFLWNVFDVPSRVFR